MSIRFSCQCGRVLNVSDEKAGKQGKCPQCGNLLTVPAGPTPVAPAPVAPAPVASAPVATSVAVDDDGGIPFADPYAIDLAAAIPKPAPPIVLGGVVQPKSAAKRTAAPQVEAALRTGGIQRHLYWVLLLVLLPLAWSTLHHSDADDQTFKARLQQTVHAHPEVAEKLDALPDDATKHDLFDAMPGDRLDGALLPERTWMHWAFAGVSGAVFLTAALLLFPAGHAKPTHLVGIGLLTGTVGIFLLLAFQWLAFHMPLFRGHGWITLVLDFIWLIGQSYRMALGDHGFVLSFLGFTAGVGFCEEACKALPLIVRAAGDGFSSWRSAMLWGLISGIGFGVSEGITYSVDYYNGISGVDAYVVRFVSCVGLHGIWAAATGIAIYRQQDLFRSVRHPSEWLLYTLQVVIVPMVLHGLYDTLLKQNHDGYALLVAAASFGWLAYQIERAERAFADAGGRLATA